LQELGQAITEVFSIVSRMRTDGGTVTIAPSQVTRQVFLDGELGLQLGVKRQVGDAKSAGFAQHFAYQVLAVVEQGAVRQDQRATPFAFVIAAVRAGAGAGLFGEAAGAKGGE